MGVGLMPTDTYVDDIFTDIQGKFPVNYSPRDRSHRPSTRFLKREKIRGLWHELESTKRATALFLNGPMREIAEALILTSMSNEEVAETVAYLGGMDMPAKAITEFRHYFWNTELMTFDDWSYYLSRPHIKALQLTALKSPKNPDGVKLTLYKMGLMPTSMNKLNLLVKVRDISYMNFLEANGFPQGLKKSTMLLNYGSLVKSTQDKLDEYEAGEQDVIHEFYKHLRVESHQATHKNLKELEGEYSEQGTRQLSSGDSD